ncbi:MAG: hypothetical protein CVU39_23095 [Chloroflexi bacterium HGW-Chloroflexi-10]|nr:MAG: hypothetical protein CVU39_23095 [Chloroflexi bacterium HGW-Chloroflexi-10]
MLQSWKAKAKKLKREVYTLWLAYRMPGVPWYARLFGALVVAYAFSPIDLIPDFIPVLGYLDDLILIPLGVMLAVRMLPEDIVNAARIEAETRLTGEHPENWIFGAAIIVLWVLVIVFVVYKIWITGR